ncbi:GDP-mannose 4,6-dehydratase [Magnetospirillum sp. UT-4]|uniref:GDP-mannose 4,6-dehydratase n=1 Tax=Magnetospirillum sp. UT-4 TaxID=2681467 RepID=UPI00137DF2F9|nr:GDP-mannose 4,6-dehydratase [Magnetospirillum sp. UT-4]CAA7621663.1 GDP-mannose 4,6-dehydratase [Magnetospirillum sp. UT-4]
MKALIIGVSGQDGAYLARHLAGLGMGVWGTSRRPAAEARDSLDRLGVAPELVRLDPADPAAVRALLADLRPDQIYLLSAQSSVSVSFERPAETIASIVAPTVAVLEAMRTDLPAARLFHAGSSECFGTVDAPCGPNSPFFPPSPYAVAKAAATWTVTNYRQAYGLFAVTGILFNHESPLHAPRYVSRKIVITAARIAGGSGERLSLGNLDVARDWGWAPEIVVGMQRMLGMERPEDLVIATGHTATLRAYLDEAFSSFGLDWRDHVDASAGLVRPTDVTCSMADVRRTTEVLDWRAETAMPGIVRRLIEHEATGNLF